MAEVCQDTRTAREVVLMGYSGARSKEERSALPAPSVAIILSDVGRVAPQVMRWHA